MKKSLMHDDDDQDEDATEKAAPKVEEDLYCKE